MAIVGAIAGEDVSILCSRLLVLAETNPTGILICDVGGAIADLTAVHALARLRLTATRLGREIRLRALSPELAQLLDVCGLGEVFGIDTTSGSP
ncbi:MAG TPA: STAS domain-containing protein [Solirubrobacteraceae bacterium]